MRSLAFYGWYAAFAMALVARVGAQEPVIASSGDAHTVAAHRLQVGLIEPLRYGVSDDVELFTQPLLIVLVPQIGVQVQWFSDERYAIATRHRLSYPKPLLDTLAKEGSFGLLPASSRIPVAVVVDLDALFTAQLAPAHRVSAMTGLSVAPRGSSHEMPLLDFPFLYSRFAVMKTTAVLRLGGRYDVRLGARVQMTVDAQYFYLPVIDGGFSFEPGAAARFVVGRHIALELGLRLAYAHYPAGDQFHYLPFADVICAW